ncbi:MAG TPA: MFS transporter [Fimbriimonas sp.]|nr:MFS transporter [Fimbriimonas sp.]
MSGFPTLARLWLMMLLEYAVWGAWAAVAGKYFTDPPPRGLGFEGSFSGLLFSLLPLGSIAAPILIGPLADKWIRAERLLGVLCLIGTVLLYYLSLARTEGSLLWLMLLYALLFAPTTTLTNAIAFAHLKNAPREFGLVRVGGTIGWFVALACLTYWRFQAGGALAGDLFRLSACFSLVLGIYALTLPATEPQHSGKSMPLLDAMSLFKDRGFRAFSASAFILGISLDYYYIFGSAYFGAPKELGGVGVSAQSLPTLMMLPQCSEILVMVSLGASLPRLGIKRAFVIGFSAWVLRYALLTISPSIGATSAALLLHGLCFTFVFAVASLYVNEIAPPQIRASAQALVTIGLFGFGRFFGSHLSGWVHNVLTQRTSPRMVGGISYQKVTDWTIFYSIPLACTLAALLLLLLFFREPLNSERVK